MNRLDRLLGGYGSVLRSRDMRWLVVALSVSQVGDWLYAVGLVAYVYEYSHSILWLAILTFARQLPAFLLGPVAGALADRMNRRVLLIWCDLIRAGLMAVLTVMAVAHSPVAAVIVVAVVARLVGTPYLPAVTAETPRLVSERDLAAANSLIGTVSNVAVVLGPLLGALALLLGPVSVTFAVNGVTFLASAAAVLAVHGMSAPARAGGAGRPSLLADAWDGLRATAASAPARAIMVLLVCTTAVYGADTVILVVAANQQFGAGTHGYGYLLGGLGVGGVLAIPFVNRMAGSRRVGTLLYAAAALVALPTAVLVWVHAIWPAVVLEVISGLALMLVEVTTITALQRSLPDAVMARVFGVYDSFYMLGIALGAFVAQPMVDAFGLGTTFVVYGLGLPALMLFTLPALRQIDRASAIRLDALAERTSLFASLDLFTGATEPVLEGLAAAARPEHVPAGTVVVSEGEPADAFYAVRSGELTVTAKGEGGRSRWVNDVHPGGYFGELGLVLGTPRTATVRAESDCELYRVGGTDFLSALNGSPATAPVAIEGMAQRLARTHPTLAMQSPLVVRSEEGMAT